MCQMLLLLPQMLFYLEIHEFLKISWICLFGKNRAWIHLTHWSCRKYFLQKLTQFSQGNHVLESLATKMNVFLWGGVHVLLQHCWIVLLGTNRVYFHLEKPKLHEVFPIKQTQFSQASSVLDAPASNTSHFQLRDTCPQISWIGQFGTKWDFLHLENSELQEVCP
jgi:hypothetical protein